LLDLDRALDSVVEAVFISVILKAGVWWIAYLQLERTWPRSFAMRTYFFIGILAFGIIKSGVTLACSPPPNAFSLQLEQLSAIVKSDKITAALTALDVKAIVEIRVSGAEYVISGDNKCSVVAGVEYEASPGGRCPRITGVRVIRSGCLKR
jgi:hypothetical protein